MNSETPKYPHVPAAFINAIAEEGTKAEAIHYLQETWNELCAARRELRALSAKQPPEGYVLVRTPQGMREPLEKIGNRLLDFYRDRFALANPVQHTDNERQVLIAALKLLRETLAASPATEGEGKA